jgi:hypothetical protein
MQIADFELERYFAQYEFTTRYLLCASDVEGYAMRDLLSLADAETRELWDRLTLGYTESAGLPALRAEVASLYDSVSPDDVMMFAGHELARSIGAQIAPVPLDARNGRSGPTNHPPRRRCHRQNERRYSRVGRAPPGRNTRTSCARGWRQPHRALPDLRRKPLSFGHAPILLGLDQDRSLMAAPGGQSVRTVWALTW